MDNFTKAERIEAQLINKLFKQVGVTNYTITPEKSYSQHDGTYVRSNGDNVIYEVKVRYVGINQYPTTVIEQAKYDYMIKTAKETNSTPYLLAFYPKENKVLYIDLTENLDFTTTTQYAPKTTCGDNQMVQKSFVNIPIRKNQILDLC